ncbi:MAG: T9SS type A sorting domain-containing protein, partial [Candidatus Eisenbacteria bacterium]|nr:T9SS type A sorting domain-containing protein [Candidatus Eisenbacteria bacterium]
LTPTSLFRAASNPIRSSGTLLSFDLKTQAKVVLEILNASGQLVRTTPLGTLEPGYHQSSFVPKDRSGRQLATGIYFLRLTVEGQGSERRVIKLVLTK